jgi:hypothetical protein
VDCRKALNICNTNRAELSFDMHHRYKGLNRVYYILIGFYVILLKYHCDRLGTLYVYSVGLNTAVMTGVYDTRL